ncbi:MAG TPA: protein phosphatase 2C domain-containing protein [Candidatus Binataceae bacterium]|nr:protein phosphatase 2C domain-containing protein [Candidatus Binataceae bacterium]
MATSPAEVQFPAQNFDLALLSDAGTERDKNEDSAGDFVENADSVVFAVADGLGGYEGGEVASSMAIEITLRTYRESPAAWGPARRLYRAVQRANINIHNKALSVPELRMMGTTLTVVAVENGMLFAAHTGDCRLHLVRDGRITQISRDHTIVAERVRMGLMSARDAREHPERSVLARCLGHDLIASVDRISMPLVQDDRLILCSDGLHGVIEDHEMEKLTTDVDAATACRRLIDTANQRGTPDNLTCVVFNMLAPTGHKSVVGWRDRLHALLIRRWAPRLIAKPSASVGRHPDGR